MSNATEGREAAALRALVDTINATGGLIEHGDGSRAPAGDPDWIDLADAYAMACEALGVAEVIQSWDGREDDDEETRIRAYEAQGMTRSDAQACVMADDAKAARDRGTCNGWDGREPSLWIESKPDGSAYWYGEGKDLSGPLIGAPMFTDGRVDYAAATEVEDYVEPLTHAHREAIVQALGAAYSAPSLRFTVIGGEDGAGYEIKFEPIAARRPSKGREEAAR